MLKLENICFSYDNKNTVLHDISLEISKGKRIVFLGENGSGKSTLFLIMNGVMKANKGNIYLNGEKISYNEKSLNKLRKKVGIIFQDPDTQIFAPTVFQEVAYGLENLGYSREVVEEKVNETLKSLELEHLSDRPCHHLSYGQKKRVSIAGIVTMEPDILILDEPTVWLDIKNVKKVKKILEKLYQKGKTTIISTHEIEFAYEMGDYIYILDKGKIVKQGTKNEIFADYEFLKNINLDIPLKYKFEKFLKEKNISMEEFYNYIK